MAIGGGVLESLFEPYRAAGRGDEFQPPGYLGTDLASLLDAGSQQQGHPGGGPTSPGNLSGNRWEQLARRMAAKKYGWGPQDFRYIDWIIGGGGPNDVVAESGWNPGAVNPSSGAYGIPQILPQAHPDTNLQNDPRGQVRWLLNYVKQRYGSPEDAYAFKSDKGWY